MDTAIILAAGKGVRMRPYTDKLPKCLVPIHDEPFLSYLIAELRAAGITRYIVIVGYLKKQVEEYFTKNSIPATFIVQSEQKGTGHALLQAALFVDRDEFLVLGADNLWKSADIRAVSSETMTVIAATEVEHPERYGVLEVENDLLKEIIEKPENPRSNLINTGLYRFTDKIFPLLKGLSSSPRGEIELTDAISLLAKLGEVKVKKVGFWLDLGCPDDIKKIESEVGSCAESSAI